ncbi:hypothetical protein PF010_g17247 [Phytophthora fragariae]|uniref:Nucleotide-diphospho-sugar transferase domain-containing protein n=2 Tax=Phytophthora fragariae TaxID=53985 RepID=A0A6A3RFA1_9STRA|nr:hypothetical protein PF003_g29603 [Phytophthora fragariae]KAE8991743.1 hypothetical protein PF011_g17822 [Phytophthora fragariae]KAE9094045.1 hypothetical protein PF010_g17247 [Phytophthora fragariae]KAE9095090.1 hypothetical protein PF007_g17517 [Phytophthora fragariae]KAE9209138.1 hypothetical protein PF004_g16560 [Phytophthora fragariae]
MATSSPMQSQVYAQTQETEPLIDAPESHIRALSEPVVRCWRRWPRVFLTLGAFLYVSVLVVWASSNSDKTSDDARLSAVQPESRVPVRPLPSGEAAPRRLQCVAWRATGRCRPNGPREPQNDKKCSDVIVNGMSGFCEVEDVDTGERFQVMQRHCTSLKDHVRFRCSDAPSFVSYHFDGHEAVQKALSPGFSLPHVTDNGLTPRDGIVMVVYPKLLASAYATVRVLRDVLKCRLPIEIWFHVDEIGSDYALLAPLQQLAIFVGGVSFHPMYNPRAKGFLSKVFAIYNSHFQRVLFLDADNVPVRDPSFLFTSAELEANGAVFWPDFWHPRRTLFNLHARSMLWELLDTPFVDMFEQESGQLLVDRTRHAAPLELVYFYAFHEPNFIQKLDVVYGDKDLFRLAWMKLKAPFHMIEALPATAGRLINGSFCGMTMVQHDAAGEILFLHRNQHKLTGERDERMEKAAMENKVVPPGDAFGAPQPDGYPDAVIWTHLLSYRKDASRRLYSIDAYRADPQFPEWQPCYGRRYVDKQKLFELQEFANLSFAGIETDIRHFAMEAARLRHA